MRKGHATTPRIAADLSVGGTTKSSRPMKLEMKDVLLCRETPWLTKCDHTHWQRQT